MSFVLLMDGTCKTNRYNMPLLIISSVDQFGSTYIVACCLMRDETIVSYRRALLSFKQLFGPAAPAIDAIVTDQESALMNAISEQFPNSHHQLCRWHLKENVKKNFKSNPLFCSHFSRLMMCNSEDLTYQMCYGMCENYSNKENAYLNRAYGLKEKFVEVWVSRYRNLGIRSTQRAESMNHAFKCLLKTNSPLVDLFHALKDMTKNHIEASAFMKLQMRDRQRIHHPLLSSLAGQVSSYILGLMESECSKMTRLSIGMAGNGHIFFNDGIKFSVEHGCNCAFFVNYSTPCAHMLKLEGAQALSSFHPVWIISDVPIARPAILHGPRQEMQISAEDKMLAEIIDTISYVNSRLFDMNPCVALPLAKRIRELVDSGCSSSPIDIQDPPVLQSRGRPPKRAKNSFRGNPDL